MAGCPSAERMRGRGQKMDNMIYISYKAFYLFTRWWKCHLLCDNFHLAFLSPASRDRTFLVSYITGKQRKKKTINQEPQLKMLTSPHTVKSLNQQRRKNTKYWLYNNLSKNIFQCDNPYIILFACTSHFKRPFQESHGRIYGTLAASRRGTWGGSIITM